MTEHEPHETPRRPYNRLTEAMAEVATQINSTRQFLQALEMQFTMLQRLHTQNECQNPGAFIVTPPEGEDEGLDQDLEYPSKPQNTP